MPEEFRLRRRKKAASEPAGMAPAAPPSDEQKTMLGTLGGAGMAGLHTVGSLLSTVSRGTHGTINALTGGEGGFGNLNPIDSTGGIEGSRHLERLGVLAKNDPNKWEWRDPLAGVADIAMDPLTYAAGVGLVKRGIQGVSHLTGATKAAKAIAGSKYVKPVIAGARGIADWRVGGKTHEDLAPLMENFIRGTEDSERSVRALTQRLGRERKVAGLNTPDDIKSFRMAAEGVDPTKFGGSAGSFNPAHPHVQEWKKAIHDVRDEAQMLGAAKGMNDLVDVTGVEHFPRYMSASAEKALGGGSRDLAGAGAERANRKMWLKEFHKGTTGVEELLGDKALHAALTAAGPDKLARKRAAFQHIKDNYGGLIERKYVTRSGKTADRYRQLASKIGDNPELTKRGIFGNDPYSDAQRYLTLAKKRTQAAPVVYEAIGKNLARTGGTEGEHVGKLLKSLGYETDIAAQHITKQLGLDPLDKTAVKSVKNMRIDRKLAEQLTDLAPSFKSPRAMSEAGGALKSLMRVAKAYTLSMPKSRMRDAVGGVVRNLLDGNTGRTYGDARKILAGQEIARTADAAIPEIADWLTKSGITSPTAENVTEAWRQLAGTHFPQSSGFMGDLPAGQVGRTLDDTVGDVVGQAPTTPFQQAIGNPFMTMLGRGSDKDVRWLGSDKGWANPVTGIRGVGETEKTTMPFINAAEQVGHYSDQLNRFAPFMERLRKGETADAAREAVNRSQVDYSPSRYTAAERALRDYAVPFWAFNKGSTLDTARQVANPASGTAQLIRATDRAYGNDQSVPDYLQAGSSVPIGKTADGSLRYLAGAGLMHEGATKRIGQALAGDTVGLGYDLASNLNPLIRMPAERTTGQVFHQRGAPLTDADPTIGRTLANLGEITGLRPAPEEGFNKPVTYSGDKYVEALAGTMPFSVFGSTAKNLTDTRRGPAEVFLKGGNRSAGENAASLTAGLAPLLTGLNITDVSPRTQIKTLKKQAEKIAKEAGAFESKRVGFSKAEIEKLKDSDKPGERELGLQQEAIQSLLNGLQPKRPKKSKAAKSELRLRKTTKS